MSKYRSEPQNSGESVRQVLLERGQEGHEERLGLDLGEALPEHIERQLRMLSAVIAETKGADKQLRTLAGERE